MGTSLLVLGRRESLGECSISLSTFQWNDLDEEAWEERRRDVELELTFPSVVVLGRESSRWWDLRTLTQTAELKLPDPVSSMELAHGGGTLCVTSGKSVVFLDIARFVLIWFPLLPSILLLSLSCLPLEIIFADPTASFGKQTRPSSLGCSSSPSHVRLASPVLEG